MKCSMVEGGKKEQIIAAAVQVFARRGFHLARVEEIAREAGVGKGTVYEYFSSKQQLFQEMLMQVSENHLQRLRAAMDGEGGFAKRLEDLLQVNLEFLGEHRETAKILLADYPPLGEELQHLMLRRRKELLAALERMVAEGIKGGELRLLNRSLAAEMLLGVLLAFSGQVVFDPEARPWEKIAPMIRAMLMDGLAF